MEPQLYVLSNTVGC